MPCVDFFMFIMHMTERNDENILMPHSQQTSYTLCVKPEKILIF